MRNNPQKPDQIRKYKSVSSWIISRSIRRWKKVEVKNCEAGKLPDILSVLDANKIEWLIIKGDINGTDFKFIHELPQLCKLDLSEVDIVSGGEAYQRITMNDQEIDYLRKTMR